MNLADQFTYFFEKNPLQWWPTRHTWSASPIKWPKWPGSRKTPREVGKRGPNSLVVAKGAQHSWTWLWGCRAIQVTWGENKNHYEPTSINMESRRFFFSWLKLILASRSLKGNEKLMVIWYDGCLLVWFAANRASYLAEWLLVRLTKTSRTFGG